MTLWRRPQNPQRGGVILWLLLLLLLAGVLGALYGLRQPLLRAFAEWWVVDEPPEKADAIVVLGGDNRAADRVRHAAALYGAGWAPKLVLSGPSIRPYLTEGDLMQRDAVGFGVPESALLVARHAADSTLAEALALRPVLAEHNFQKIIVVSSNFHARRARAIFRAVFAGGDTQVVVSAAPDSNFNPAYWWRQREGRILLALEVLKSLYTWWELRELPPKAPAQPEVHPLGFTSPLSVRYSALGGWGKERALLSET